LHKFERTVSLLAWGFNEEDLVEAFLHRAFALLEETVTDYEARRAVRRQYTRLYRTQRSPFDYDFGSRAASASRTAVALNGIPCSLSAWLIS
jgi:hypothetical protein